MDELELPWGIALRMYGLHIQTKLMHSHGYSPKDAKQLYEAAKGSPNELIREILNELIQENQTSNEKRIDDLFKIRIKQLGNLTSLTD